MAARRSRSWPVSVINPSARQHVDVRQRRAGNSQLRPGLPHTSLADAGTSTLQSLTYAYDAANNVHPWRMA